MDTDCLVMLSILNLHRGKSIKDLQSSINRIISKGHLSIIDNRLCPSIELIHFFVEILQYEEDINERLLILSRKMR